MSLAKPKTDADMVLRSRAAMQDISQPALRDFIEFRIDQQVILAGLRRRNAGADASALEPIAGASRWVRHIAAHWGDPNFKLAAVYPWIGEARGYLDGNNAAALDSLMMRVIWQRLGPIAESNKFGFEAVFAFVFKWDILQAWLARDAAQAKSRFHDLIKEIKNDS